MSGVVPLVREQDIEVTVAVDVGDLIRDRPLSGQGVRGAGEPVGGPQIDEREDLEVRSVPVVGQHDVGEAILVEIGARAAADGHRVRAGAGVDPPTDALGDSNG